MKSAASNNDTIFSPTSNKKTRAVYFQSISNIYSNEDSNDDDDNSTDYNINYSVYNTNFKPKSTFLKYLYSNIGGSYYLMRQYIFRIYSNII